MSEKWERLVGVLVDDDAWVTAARLADRLGVTTRTVRSYAAQANSGREPIVESGAGGYRLDRGAWARMLRSRSNGSEGADGAGAAGPDGRRARLIRDLLDADEGVDVHGFAAAAHVSESTVEADLGRVRGRLEGTGLRLERDGARVRLAGPESAVRRLVGALVREEGRRGVRDLAVLRDGLPNMTGFRSALVEGLDAAGLVPNELALDDVLLHVAIAVDRVARDRPLDDAVPSDGMPAAATTASVARPPTPPSPSPQPSATGRPVAEEQVAALVDRLVREQFDVALPAADVAHLSRLVGLRAATPRTGPAHAGMIREILEQVSRNWMVELDDDDFVERLALHVDSLAARAAGRSYSRNPLTASIKASYPLTYDLAVLFAGELGRRDGITVNDDEIAYLAMHLGAQIERTRARGEAIRVVVDMPEYRDIRARFVERLASALGDDAETTTGGHDVDVDLLVTVLPPSSPLTPAVIVSPIPTDEDVDRIRTEVARVRRSRRRARLAALLSRTIGPELFVRGVEGSDREAVIRLLGDRLIDAGVVDAEYVEGALERERLSSTAFTDLLAVPHAMTMTARRSAIAIAIDEHAIPWGGTDVHVVAFIAFAEDGRAEFQAVFDQFVEAFSEPENVRRLVRGATDYRGLLAELSGIMAT